MAAPLYPALRLLAGTMVRVRLGSLALLLLLFVNLPVHADDPPLEVSEQADAADDEVLKNTLYVSISADDIYRSETVQALVNEQSKQMMAASKRRIARQEKRIDEMRAQIEAGKAQPDDMKPLVAEMNRRLEIGYLAIARSSVLDDIVLSAQREKLKPRRGGGRLERYAGERPFTPATLRVIQAGFQQRFGRPLPISAHGDTELHRALGFDHRGRVDVALSPDQPEGVWLRNTLETMRVPYYAFRMAIPGSATAPHIHIGPGSTRTFRPAVYTRSRGRGRVSAY